MFGRYVLCIGVGAAALAGGACGGGSDQDQIRTAFSTFQDAFAKGEYEDACAVTTRDAQRHVGYAFRVPARYAPNAPPENCPLDMRKLARLMKRNEGAHGTALPRIVRVAVEGDRATAVIALAGSTSPLAFARDGDDWKIDAVYGAVPAGEQRDKF